MSRRCTLPLAALPSLPMAATSAMDPNLGAVAPYESNAGARRPGSRALRRIYYHSQAARPGVRLCHGGVLFLRIGSIMSTIPTQEMYTVEEGGKVHRCIGRCIRAQGRQQKHSERRKSTEDTVLKKSSTGFFRVFAYRELNRFSDHFFGRFTHNSTR